MLCGCCDASLPRRGGSFSTAHPADGKHSALLHPSIRIASDSSSGDLPCSRLLRPRISWPHLSVRLELFARGAAACSSAGSAAGQLFFGPAFASRGGASVVGKYCYGWRLPDGLAD